MELSKENSIWHDWRLYLLYPDLSQSCVKWYRDEKWFHIFDDPHTLTVRPWDKWYEFIFEDAEELQKFVKLQIPNQIEKIIKSISKKEWEIESQKRMLSLYQTMMKSEK